MKRSGEELFSAQRSFLGLLEVFSPSVCSMLGLQLAVLLGKFLDCPPPQLHGIMFESLFFYDLIFNHLFDAIRALC